MKIYSYALSIVLCVASTSNAFLHAPVRSSTRVQQHTAKRTTSTSTSLFDSSLYDEKSLISQLSFYPSDEPLSERIKAVQKEFDHVKESGIGKFLSDELDAAEKVIQNAATAATSSANDVITKSEADAEGNGDYLLKGGFDKMGEAGRALAHEMWEVRQEFDELKAAKIVEEAAEDVVGTDVMIEKDLEKVVENVVSSLEDAKEVIQSAITTVESTEGLTDVAKAELTEKLEERAQQIEQSISVADSVAKTAEKIAIEDEKIMDELVKTGDRLSSAIDATESITESLKGTEGGEAMDAVSKSVDATASIVKEDLSAAESIADSIGKKIVAEADAIQALDEKAAGSIEAVRAAKSSIEDCDVENPNCDRLAEELTKDIDNIKADENSAEKLAQAIQKDTASDQEAFDTLGSSSKEIDNLINAVDDAVDKAEEASTQKEIESKSSVEKRETESESKEESDSDEESSSDEDKSDSEESSSFNEEGSDSEEDSSGEETEAESEEQEEESSDESDSSEEKEEDSPEEPTYEGDHDSTEKSDNDKSDIEVSSSNVEDSSQANEPTSIASGLDHDSESLGDALANAADNTAQHASETIDTMVASTGDAVSSSSDAVSDAVTSTTEALAETVAVVSSLFL